MLVSIPKDPRASLINCENYRAIALYSSAIYVTGYSTKGNLDTRLDRWTCTHEQEHIKTYGQIRFKQKQK